MKLELTNISWNLTTQSYPEVEDYSLSRCHKVAFNSRQQVASEHIKSKAILTTFIILSICSAMIMELSFQLTYLLVDGNKRLKFNFQKIFNQRLLAKLDFNLFSIVKLVYYQVSWFAFCCTGVAAYRATEVTPNAQYTTLKVLCGDDRKILLNSNFLLMKSQ